MRTTEKQFEKDFATELDKGMLWTSDTLSPKTIFILEDGLCVNAEYEFGFRLTDHHCVLCEEGYSMDHLVTIEPESGTVILPDCETTTEQDRTLLDLDQLYNTSEIQVEYSNVGHIEQDIIMYLLGAGASWESAYLTGVQHEYTQYTNEEYEELDDLDKDELFVIDDDIIVDFW